MSIICASFLPPDEAILLFTRERGGLEWPPFHLIRPGRYGLFGEPGSGVRCRFLNNDAMVSLLIVEDTWRTLENTRPST